MYNKFTWHEPEIQWKKQQLVKGQFQKNAWTRALNLRPRCGDSDTGHQISRFERCQLTMTLVSNTCIKSFSFLCGTQRIVGQKVSTKSWMAAISLSPLREHRYYLVLISNIRAKGYKMKRENNPIRLPLETWCSLSVPQCAEFPEETETLDACISKSDATNPGCMSLSTH